MSEFFEASDPVERDGDIISGADHNSLEYNLPLTEGNNLDEAVRVSSEYLDLAESGHVSEVPTPSTEESEREVSPAEKAYDRAVGEVEKRSDQGLDVQAAWHAVDPTGQIRREYQREQEAIQGVLNHREADKIRKAKLEMDIAAIKATILDSVKQEQEINRRLAKERIDEGRRKRPS